MKMMSSSFFARWRRPIGYLVGAVVFVVALIGIRYIQADAATYDVSDLERWGVVAGIDVEGWPTDDFFLNWVGGDGQVFAAFAADPVYGGDRVKSSAHRFTRAGYSWAAFAASLSVDRWVPVGLVLVNVFAVGYVAYVAFSRHEQYGKRIWWLLANPALYIAFLGDTSEALAIALLVFAMLSSSMVAAGLLATVRPSFLLPLIRNPKQLLVGGVVAVAMRLLAGQLFDSGVTNGLYNITWPLFGYFEEPSVAGFLVAGAALVTIGIGVWKRRISWVVSGLFVLLFAGPIHLSGQINVIRAAGLLPVVWALDPAVGEDDEGKEKDPPKRALARSN